MEKYTLNSTVQTDENQYSVVAEQVLNKAILDFRMKKLRQEIDNALEERNEERFMALTDELNKLTNE
ncbi:MULTISPECIES: IDEAL domain-containing protein [Cytobacillus]|uniref:IDEAL domain-containing protein n=1 Tax=Cytobacillus stercorigallinarum TaxID=2762240 RepID=A0ABR8QQM9_9BACI|nr:IDEAL domain-containing protein [Cytobacillus stercorigallinarum]MBD7937813.1 IDEAL domain-containing protein [Cytobacillus stercorigallinarum]